MLQILSEAERKNESCLSPEQSEVEFFHFSKANLEFAKSGKQSDKWVLKQLRVTFSDAIAKQYEQIQHNISTHFVKLFQKKISTVSPYLFDTGYRHLEMPHTVQQLPP